MASPAPRVHRHLDFSVPNCCLSWFLLSIILPARLAHAMPGGLGSVSANMGSSRSDGSGKERLRWTQELHDRFEEAVNQLGGADSKFELNSKCTAPMGSFLFLHVLVIDAWFP